MFLMCGNGRAMVNLDTVEVLEAEGLSVIAYVVDGSEFEIRKFNTHDEAVKFIQDLHTLLGRKPWK